MRSNSNRYAIQPDCPSRDVFAASCAVNRKHKCFYLTCSRSTYVGNKYLRFYLQLIPRNCKAAIPLAKGAEMLGAAVEISFGRAFIVKMQMGQWELSKSRQTNNNTVPRRRSPFAFPQTANSYGNSRQRRSILIPRHTRRWGGAIKTRAERLQRLGCARTAASAESCVWLNENPSDVVTTRVGSNAVHLMSLSN